MMKSESVKLIAVTEFNQDIYKDIYDRAYIEDREGFLYTFCNAYRKLEFDYSWNRYFIVESVNKSAGIAKFDFGSDRKVADTYIYLRKPYRRNGIGTQTKRNLIELAFNAGFEKVQTSVIRKNEAAVQMNKKLGGDIEGIIKKSYWIDGKGYDKIIFGFFKNAIDEESDPPAVPIDTDTKGN